MSDSDLDWEIREAEDRDRASIRALLTAAFDGPGEADLTEALRADGDAVYEFVAESAGAVIGHVLLSRMKAPKHALALAPVAVAASCRKQGVAASLIETALAMALVDGWRGVFVLGDLAYYERFGFEADAAKPFSSPYAGEHFGLAQLDEDEPLKGSEAVYPPAFGKLG